MSSGVFRASSLGGVDPEWLDRESAAVLTAMFGGSWSRVPAVYILNPVLSSTVAIGGAAADSITVSVNKTDCSKLLSALNLASEVSEQELLDELANTLAGHLKVGMGDGLVTGIPEKGGRTGEYVPYRSVFASSGVLIEVESHA